MAAPILPMDQSLRAVLSQANAEQNQFYPVNVFETHYNLVSSWLMDEAVKVYPENRSVVDLLRPFFAKKMVPVKFGKIELPEDYRHLTGGGIYVNDKKVCLDQPKEEGWENFTPDQLKQYYADNQVICIDINVVDVDQYNDLTRHSYKQPTLDFPIAADFESDHIKITPPDVPYVELRYIRAPKKYKYGYVVNPDESYSYDPTMEGAVESEWRSNAEAYIFKGLYTLYSIYARDGELRQGGQELKQLGLF
jgi:hypothetical protein